MPNPRLISVQRRKQLNEYLTAEESRLKNEIRCIMERPTDDESVVRSALSSEEVIALRAYCGWGEIRRLKYVQENIQHLPRIVPPSVSEQFTSARRILMEAIHESDLTSMWSFINDAIAEVDEMRSENHA